MDENFLEDDDFVLSVFDQESNGNVDAIGPQTRYGRARGIGQIMPGQFENLRKKGAIPEDADIDNPVDNVKAALATLEEEKDRYGDPLLTLAAYNAGSPTVDLAIKAARRKGIGTDFKSLSDAGLLPTQTREYVPRVLEHYAKRKNKKLEAAAEVYAQDDETVQQLGTPGEFALRVQDVATEPGFDDLSSAQKVKALSSIFNSKKWLPQVEETFKKTTQGVWNPTGEGYVEDIPDIAPLANPYLAAVEGETEEALTASVAEQKSRLAQDLKKNGVSPALFGNLIDDAFDRKVAQKRLDNRGVLQSASAYAGAAANAFIGTGLTVASGAANALGYEEAADSIRGANPFDPHSEFDFETDENGNVEIGDDGKPITKWQGTLIRTVGSVFGAIGAGVGIGATAVSAGASAPIAAGVSILGLGGINALSNADAAYELAQSEGFSREAANEAALWTLPASGLDTIANYLSAGTGKAWIPALTGMNKIRAIAKLGPRAAAYTARGAVLGAVSGASQQVGIEYGLQRATGGEYQANQDSIRAATVGGALAGGAFSAYEGRNSPNPPRPVPRPVPEVQPWHPSVGQKMPLGLPAPEGYGERLALPPGGNRLRLDPPDWYRERENRASPEEQRALSREFEAFQNASDKKAIFTYSDPDSIDPDLLSTFQYSVEKQGDNGILVTKNTSHIPFEGDDLPDVIDSIDYLTHDLATSPDPADMPRLLEERERLTKQSLANLAGEPVDKATAAEAADLAQRRGVLKREINKIQKQLTRAEDPVIRDILRQELKELRIQHSAMKEFRDSPQGRAMRIRERLSRVNNDIKKLSDSLYINNRAEKQNNLNDLLIKRAALQTIPVEAVPKTTGENAGDPVTKPTLGGERAEVTNAFKALAVEAKTKNGTLYILPLNGKYYAMGENGEVLTKGHTWYKDALTAGKQARIPKKIILQGEGVKIEASETSPLKFVSKRKQPGKEDLGFKILPSVNRKKLVPKKVKGGRRDKKSKGTTSVRRSNEGNISVPGDESSRTRSFGVSGSEDSPNEQPGEFGRVSSGAGDSQRSSKTAASKRDGNVRSKSAQSSESGAQLSSGDQAIGNTIDKRKFQVAPIENDGSEILGPKEISKLAQKLFKKRVDFGGKFRDPKGKIVLGNYNVRSQRPRVRFHGDLASLSHEFPHYLSDELEFGSEPRIAQHPRSEEIIKEALDLSPGGSGGPGMSAQYNTEEGVAEYIRGRAVNPDFVKENYPALTEYYDERVPEALKKNITAMGDAIRRNAGAPGMARTKAQISFDPEDERTSFRERAETFLHGTDLERFQITGADKLKINLNDDAHAVIKALSVAENIQAETEGQKRLGSKSGRTQLRTLAGAWDKVRDTFVNGQRTVDGKRLNKGISYITESLDGLSKQDFNDDFKTAMAVAVSERTLEVADRVKGKPITGVAGGEDDVLVARQTLQEFEALPDAQKERIREVTRRYREWAKNNLDYLVESGRITPKMRERIEAENEYYVDLQRVMDEETAGKVLPRFEGSGRKIGNPLENLLKNTQAIIREADRNTALRTVADSFDFDRPMYGDTNPFADIMHRVDAINATDKNVVKVYRNGIPEYWKAQEDVYEKLKSINETPAGSAVISATFGRLSRLLKAGVSRTPFYASKNFIRDTKDRLATSDIPIGDQLRHTAKALYAAYNPFNQSSYRAMKSDADFFGIGQSGAYAQTRENYAKIIAEATTLAQKDENFILYVPKKLLGFYDEIIQRAEHVGRLAEFNAQREKLGRENPGASAYDIGKESAAKARATMDFKVKGKMMGTIENMLPYTNSTIRGTEKLINTLRTNPLGFAARATILAVIPTILNRLYIEAQGKDEEYDQFPEYRKHLYSNWPMEDGSYVAVPEGYANMVVSEITNRLWDAAKGRPQGFDLWQFTKNTLAGATPFDNALPIPFKPTVEAIANYDFFREKRIVSPYKQDLSLENRENPDPAASRIGNVAEAFFEYIGAGEWGKKVFNARAWDHQMQGYLGNTGKLFTQISDIGRESGGKPLSAGDLTGIIRKPDIGGYKDIQAINDFIESNGISSQNKHVKRLREAQTAYYNAAPADKEKAEKHVRVVAKEIREGQERLGDAFYRKKKSKKMMD